MNTNVKTEVELKNPDACSMMPDGVLVEYFDLNEKMKMDSGVELFVQVGKSYGASDKTASGEGRHMERTGKVVSVPEKLTTKKHKWKTEVNVQKGDYVWFSSSSFSGAHKFYSGDRRFALLDYHQLYMRQRDGEDEMLNGYCLAEKVKQPAPSNIIVAPKDKYFDNVFRLFNRGAQIDYEQDIYYDDPRFKTGDLVRARFNAYPLLEEPGHRLYSNKELMVFQAKELIGWVEM